MLKKIQEVFHSSAVTNWSSVRSLVYVLLSKLPCILFDAKWPTCQCNLAYFSLLACILQTLLIANPGHVATPVIMGDLSGTDWSATVQLTCRVINKEVVFQTRLKLRQREKYMTSPWPNGQRFCLTPERIGVLVVSLVSCVEDPTRNLSWKLGTQIFYFKRWLAFFSMLACIHFRAS